MKTKISVVCNAPELLTSAHGKVTALFLEKIIRKIRISDNKKNHKKSKDNLGLQHPEVNELLTTEHVKATALFLRKIIRISGNQKNQKKSKYNLGLRHPEVNELGMMLIDDNEAKNIDNENLENEQRERAVTSQ